MTFEGIADNLKQLPLAYNDSWVMRLYYDLENDHPLMRPLCDLACSNSHLDLCHIQRLPGTNEPSNGSWNFMFYKSKHFGYIVISLLLFSLFYDIIQSTMLSALPWQSQINNPFLCEISLLCQEPPSSMAPTSSPWSGGSSPPLTPRWMSSSAETLTPGSMIARWQLSMNG